jgi:hypothetical protein
MTIHITRELYRLARDIHAMTEAEIIEHDPPHNDLWHFSDEGFSAFMSDLPHPLDPWNRPLDKRHLTPHIDNDGDTTHWTGFTTVRGHRIRLTLWND